MIKMNGKLAIAGVAFLSGAVLFGLYAWSQAVNRSAEEAVAEAEEVQNFYNKDSEDDFFDGKEIKEPDLDRKVIVTATLSETAKAMNIERIAYLTKQIKDGSEDFSYWLELGLYRKAIGDIEGAEQIWSYVAVTNPTDAISLSNLYNLYLYEKKDYAQAEKFLLGAIERNPTQILYYESAYEFYHYVVKNDEKGKEVIRVGLLADPKLRDGINDILSRF